MALALPAFEVVGRSLWEARRPNFLCFNRRLGWRLRGESSLSNQWSPLTVS